MPGPHAADYKVEIVDASGAPDMQVSVVGDQVVDLSGGATGDVLVLQSDGTVAPESPSLALPLHHATHEDGGVDEVTLAQSQITGLVNALNLKADLVSPALTGNPTAPTATPGDSDTSIATTAFVTAADAALVIDSIADTDATHAPSRNAVFDALALKAPLASPALTGNPTAPTATPGDADTSIATTAFVAAAVIAATLGLFDDRGGYDASVNTFPATGGSGTAGAVLKGDVWTVTVAGTLGGVAVVAGDLVRALVDTPGQTAGNWSVAEHNLGYVPENIANKDTDGTLAANSDTKYASQKAVKTYADTKAPLASPALTGNPTAPTPSPGDSDTSIATSAFVAAAIAAKTAYHYLSSGRARLDVQVATTTGINEAGVNSGAAGSGCLNVFYLDPADWPAGATLRVKIIVLTNDTAPASNFTAGLYPIGTPAGGATTVTAPFGTVTTGSTAAVTAPSADSKNVAVSSDFAAPAAGWYALGFVVSANMAVSSSAGLRVTLDAKY